MNKIIIASLLLLLASKGIHAQDQETDPWAEITRDPAVVQQVAPAAAPQASTDAPASTYSVGKTSGTALLSVVTGLLMTASLRFIKELEAPYIYPALSGALLVSLYDMAKRQFGADYGSAACWGAIATNIASGLVLVAID